jgi:hypothetical protein
MSKKKNVFISHYNKDDRHLHSLIDRLNKKGYEIRNGSIDRSKYRPYRITRELIKRYLRARINWAGTFICLIGKDTHTRPWVNYEIQQAHRLGKQIVGIYAHGCSNSVELPEAYKKYGGSIIGWNSLDKLGDILDGKITPPENPDGTAKQTPIYNIIRVAC